jgi:hypothetical protein
VERWIELALDRVPGRGDDQDPVGLLDAETPPPRGRTRPRGQHDDAGLGLGAIQERTE